MAFSWFSFKPCSESDLMQDTVKVDPNLLNKENVQPLQLQKQHVEEHQRCEAEATAKRRDKEKAAVAAATEAARLREEVERAAAERARREEAQEACRKAEEASWREERAHEEDAARYAVALAAEEDRRRVEAQEQGRLRRKEAEEKVKVWCNSNGFQDMNTQKKTLRGATKFPLHTAVKNCNQEIIGMMLIAGVDKDVRDSKNQTPIALAAKLNKGGSHGHILTMLL